MEESKIKHRKAINKDTEKQIQSGTEEQVNKDLLSIEVGFYLLLQNPESEFHLILLLSISKQRKVAQYIRTTNAEKYIESFQDLPIFIF